MIMANVIKDNDPDEALAYYEEALSVLENSAPPDHQATSNCLISMACLYSDYDFNEDALRCELKALDIKRQILSLIISTLHIT
jgi:tetratricopeptide (TPR) repeat protein